MFGLKLAIGAADNTTGVMRGVESKLKRFSSNVRTWLNLAGFVMIAHKLGGAISKAFEVSGYATEWSAFKQRMGSEWTALAGRIGDLFGPLIDDAEYIGQAMVDGVNAFIDRIQYAIAFWKRAAPKWMGGKGEGFEDAAKGASGDVITRQKELDAKYREHRRQTTVEQNAGQEAHGRVDPRWMSRPTNMRERARLAQYRAQNQSELDSTKWGMAGAAGMQNGSVYGVGLRRSVGLGAGVVHGGAGNRFTSGFHRGPDYMAQGMAGMSADELQAVAQGSLSGVRGLAKGARKSARDERKWQKMVDEARRREQHGGRLSARMQAVLASDTKREEEKRAAADAAAVKKAIEDTAVNTKNAADALTQSIPPVGGW